MACFSCGVSPDSGATSEDFKELIAGSNTQTSHQCPAPWSRRRVPLLCHPQWCLRLWPFLQSANLICQAREEPRGADAPSGLGPQPSAHRNGAEPPSLQLACPLMGQSRRHEAGLFDRATMTAREDREALSTGGLVATGIDVHQQLADFAAGGRGGQHERGEGHPRQASAVAARRDETAGAAVFWPSPIGVADVPHQC